MKNLQFKFKEEDLDYIVSVLGIKKKALMTVLKFAKKGIGSISYPSIEANRISQEIVQIVNILNSFEDQE